MSAVLRPAETASALEVVGFRAIPATADVAVLHLEGRFTGVRPRRFDRLRLHVTHGGGRADELTPVVATPEDDAGTIPFRASWAVPVQDVEGAAFALAVGRDLLLELPAPHVEAPDGEPGSSHVRLAREVNELRRRADEATTAWTGASRALEAEVARLQAEHDAALERERAEHASTLERERTEHAATLERERAEHVSLMESLRTEHDATLERERADHAATLERERAEHAAATTSQQTAHQDEVRRLRSEQEAAQTAVTRVVEPAPEEPTAVLSATPLPRRDVDLHDISGARAIAIGLLALFFLLLLVILGVGPL